MGAGQDEPQGAGLARLLEVHRAELLRFLCGRCGSRDEAQDVMQDLWIKARAQPAGPIGNPRAYLFRMANNIVLDRLRAAQRAMRRERAWLEEDHGGVAEAPEVRIDATEPVDEAIARRQEAEILRSAIAGLPEGAARALRLYRFEGMGQSEIAQVLGISRSGVEKHLALAMKHLRAALANCGSFAAAASQDHGADDGAKPRMEQGR
ncbi:MULTISPECIES: RNA polymerase sigma factor [unclassified Sphingobium]|uniref:RNA polymerase sigma factor n=1 Tax=unclassified Sphingobium TaxID=2611147 RepID=UPI000770408C|nr:MULTISPECIES: RNA polymerase sigma factor [unclassified Sphingobium]AMK25252.1 ECF subfamily RNA polymerase sigma-70 factor [Sphingobium sp. TKS]NML87908.1 RNA polymerase sigma factor [Sphingobium sp. TB-6]